MSASWAQHMLKWARQDALGAMRRSPWLEQEATEEPTGKEAGAGCGVAAGQLVCQEAIGQLVCPTPTHTPAHMVCF